MPTIKNNNDAPNTRVTEEQVLTAIKKNKGLLYAAARELGVSTKTLSNYGSRWPSVAEAISEEKGLMLDFSESKLYQAINNGEAWAICFFLKTRGKHRGFTERFEIETSHGNIPGSAGVLEKVIAEMPATARREFLAAIKKVKGTSREVIHAKAKVTDSKEDQE